MVITDAGEEEMNEDDEELTENIEETSEEGQETSTTENPDNEEAT